MPSIPEIIILALWGITSALILMSILLLCWQRRRRRCRRPSQDIQAGQSNDPEQPSAEKKEAGQGEDSSQILVEYKNEQESSDRESKCTDCAICLEEFKDGDCCTILTNCKHMYHQLCIDQWLVKNSHHCPLCRGSVHASRIDTNH